jgi:hypothetical protein
MAYSGGRIPMRLGQSFRPSHTAQLLQRTAARKHGLPDANLQQSIHRIERSSKRGS